MEFQTLVDKTTSTTPTQHRLYIGSAHTGRRWSALTTTQGKLAITQGKLAIF